MPLPFIAIAIPVLHSSGAWIASTAASGYVSGTLSSTWIGTFVLGNSSLLTGSGLVSAAGIFGAAEAIGATTAAGVGSALSAVGLGGVASFFGIAPSVTLLGLTPIGWGIAGASAVIAATFGYYFTRKTMQRLNEERQKGGLEPITIRQIISEVRLLEAQSMASILERLQAERSDVRLSADGESATIDGQVFSVGRLKYTISPDGSEEIVFLTKTGRRRRVLLVKNGTTQEDHPASAA